MLQKFSISRLFFVLLMGAFVVSAKGQNTRQVMLVDSLEQALARADSAEKPVILFQLVQFTQEFSSKLTHRYLQEYLQLSDARKLRSAQAQARYLLSEFLLAQHQSDTAVLLLRQALYFKQMQNSDPNRLLLAAPPKISKGKAYPLTFRSAAIWRWTLAFSILLFFGGLVILLFFSDKLRKKYSQKQADYGSFQLELDHQRGQLEESIKESTSELEEQLQQTRSKDVELKKTLKRFKDASYLKNAFLSNMSHEIRTPLNGIIGFSSLLETELALLENKELFDYATGIQQSGDRLLSLINNIIEISLIQANEIEVQFQACDVGLIIEKACEAMAFVANEKGLKFKSKHADLPLVMADNAKLMRVLHIVIDNAIKYTDTGFVTISAVYDPATHLVNIKVKDTGVGMDDTYMRFLFEAFRQESSGYARQYQGAGLGLPLAKKLLDLMHAHIQIDSKRNVGTTVSIDLPIIVSDEEMESSIRLKPIANLPEYDLLDIFVVEDDRMNRMVLEKILKKTSTVTLAVDGEETIKIVGERYKNKQVFQVMLFDINLPAPWDGIKLMQHIRTYYPDYKHVPFIAQTAYAMAGDRERFLDAGFDDYIAKPINKNELMTKVENQLRLRKQSRLH